MATARRRRFSAAEHDQITAPLQGRPPRSSAPAPAPDGSQWSLLKFPLIVAAVHFAIVQIAATLAIRFGTPTSPSPPFSRSPGKFTGMPDPMTGLAHWLVEPLRTWDGLWYRLIALDGYSLQFDNGGRSEAPAAFWPLYPWAMRLVSDLTGMSVETAGYLIANLCFVAALALLYRLLIVDLGERVARVSLWAIALFPTALFFSAVYTESPFLLLMVGAIYAARRGQWWIAGVVGLLAALTRSYGMFLIFPFIVLFIQQRGWHPRGWLPQVFALPIPLLGPFLFSWHLWWVYDRPESGGWYSPGNIKNFLVALFDGESGAWTWRTVQVQWNRGSAMPWETMRWAFSPQSPRGAAINVRDGAEWGWLRDLVHNPGWSLITSEAWRKSIANSDTLELLCTLLFLGLMVVGFWKLPLYQSVYLIPGLMVPLFQPSSVHVLMSMPRFGLTLFPLFAVIGVLLSSRAIRDTPVPLILGVVSGAWMFLLTLQFASWYWVS